MPLHVGVTQRVSASYAIQNNPSTTHAVIRIWGNLKSQYHRVQMISLHTREDAESIAESIIQHKIKGDTIHKETDLPFLEEISFRAHTLSFEMDQDLGRAGHDAIGDID